MATRAAPTMQWQAPRRTRDARTTVVTKPSPPRGQRGFSLIELLVVTTIAAIMAGTAYSRLPRSPYAAWNAQNQILADIRRARNDALTKGDHFRLDITNTTTYVTYRMQLVAGVWSPNGAPVRTGTLQNGVVFSNGVGRQLEFTTRGLMLVPDAAITLQLTHSPSSTTRYVTVWPSGQVAPG